MNTPKHTLKTPEQPLASPEEKIDIFDLLKLNQTKHLDNEDFKIKDKPKSKRLRDYIVIMLIINLLCPILTFLFLSINVVTILFCFSGMFMGSIGLTMIMWWIMTDY